jgi:hypothetical protein
MKMFFSLSALLFSSTAIAQEMASDPIGDARTSISQEADFDTALVLLEAFESHALEAWPTVTSAALADLNFLMGVLEFYLNQDEDAAKSRWAWALQIAPDFKWDEELVGGVGQEVFENVRQTVKSTASFTPIPEGQKSSIPVFIDGSRLAAGNSVQAGRHLIQARCGDGITRGVYAFVSEDAGVICPCPLQACFGEEKAADSGKSRSKDPGERASLGATVNAGGWYSAGEGTAMLMGVGVSYRPLSVLQVDAEAGIYRAPANETVGGVKRSNGNFLAVALSGVYAMGDVDLLGGLHGNVVLAEDTYPPKTAGGESFVSPYSGLVGGFHVGAAYNLSGGHQVGARLGYSPLVVEGDVLIYMNSVSNVFFKYGF